MKSKNKYLTNLLIIISVLCFYIGVGVFMQLRSCDTYKNSYETQSIVERFCKKKKIITINLCQILSFIVDFWKSVFFSLLIYKKSVLFG